MAKKVEKYGKPDGFKYANKNTARWLNAIQRPDATVENVASEIGWDAEQYKNKLEFEAITEQVKLQMKKQKDAEDAYNTEMALIQTEMSQRWFGSKLLKGVATSAMLDNYVENPDGTVYIYDSPLKYIPGFGLGVNLLKRVNDSEWRVTTEAEKADYQRLKREMKAGYADSMWFRTGARAEEFTDTVIDMTTDFLLDLPMILEASGNTMMRREIGLAVEDFFTSSDRDEIPTAGKIAKRKDLENRKLALAKEKQDVFDKMSEEEKQQYLQNQGLTNYTIGRAKFLDIEGRQKANRGLMINSDGHPRNLTPVSSATVFHNGKEYRMEIEGEGGNPMDTKRLMIGIDGTPVLDDGGNPIYINKYSKGEKLVSAIKDTFSNTDNFLDAAASSVSFLLSGYGIGGVARGATKVMSRGVERILAKTIKKGIIGEAKASIVKSWADRFARGITTTATSYLMTNAESQQIGNQTFNNVRRNFLEDKAGIDRDKLYKEYASQGYRGEELQHRVEKEVNIAINNMIHDNPDIEAQSYGIAMAARRNAVTANNINTLTNLNYAAYFTKGASLARNLLKPKWTAGNILKQTAYLAKETAEEFMEEGVWNQYAQLSAEALAKRKSLSLSDYLKEGLWESENLEQGVLGALMGLGQSGLMESVETFNNARNYKKLQKPQVEQLNAILKYNKEDVNKYLQNVVSEITFADSASKIDKLQAEGKYGEAEVVSKKMLMDLALQSAAKGTAGVLIDNLKKLQNTFSEMTDESGQINTENTETVQILQKAIDFAEMTADIHDNHIYKHKSGKLTELLLNSHIQGELVERLTTERLSQIDNDISEEIERLNKNRKKRFIEKLEDTHPLMEARSKVEEYIRMAEKSQEGLLQSYHELNSPKGQKEAREEIEKIRRKSKLLSKSLNKKNVGEKIKEVKEETGKAVTPAEYNKAIETAKENDKNVEIKAPEIPEVPTAIKDKRENLEKNTSLEMRKIIDTTSIPDFTVEEMEATGPVGGQELFDRHLQEAQKKKQRKVLGQPRVLNKSLQNHNDIVERFKNTFNDMNKRAKSLGLEGIKFVDTIQAIAAQKGYGMAESAYNFIKEAFKKSEAYQGESEDFFNQQYSEYFGNNFVKEGQTTDAATSQTSPKSIEKATSEQIENTLKDEKVNPNTAKNVDWKGRDFWKVIGRRISEAIAKLPFLGTEYNTVYDGNKGEITFVDKNGKIIESSIPFLDPYLLTVGKKVSISVKNNVLPEDLSQTVPIWQYPTKEELDKGEPNVLKRVDTTFGYVIEQALSFTGKSANELINEHKTLSALINLEIEHRNSSAKHGERKYTRRDSEIFRKFPADLSAKGMEKEQGVARGLHDFYWWNELNVANFHQVIDKIKNYLEEIHGKDAFSEQEFTDMAYEQAAQRQREVINDAQRLNLDIRESLLDNNNKLDMTVSTRRTGTNLKLRNGQVQTVAEANPTADIAIYDGKNKKFLGLKDDVDIENISGYKDFLKDNSGNFVIMIYQNGVDINGKPTYAISPLTNITNTIQDVDFKNKRVEELKKLVQSKDLIYKALAQEKEGSKANFKFQSRTLNKILEVINNFRERYSKSYLTDLYPSYMLDKNEKSIDGEFRYNAEKEFLTKNVQIPIIEPVYSIDGRFIIDVNISYVSYQDALKQNLITQLDFRRIPSQNSPFKDESGNGYAYINDIQPVIALDYANIKIDKSPTKEEEKSLNQKSETEKKQTLAEKAQQAAEEVTKEEEQKRLLPGKLVKYKGETYKFEGTDKTGTKAKLIKLDGTRFAGTPFLDKLIILPVEYKEIISTAEDKVSSPESVENPNIEKEITDSNGKKKVFTEKDFAKIKDNLFHNILYRLIEPVLSGSEFEVTGEKVQKIANQVFEEILDVYKNEELEYNYLSNIRKDILESEDGVLEDIKDFFNMDEESFNSENEENIDEGGENVRGYTQASYEVPAAFSISQKLKCFFAMVEDTKFSPTGDNFNKLKQYVPVDTVISGIQEALSKSPNNSMEAFTLTIQRLIDMSIKRVSNEVKENESEEDRKQREVKSDYYFLKGILDRINSLQEDDSLTREIRYTLYQNPVKMSFILIESKANGNFKVSAMNADSKNADILKEKDWLNNLRQSPLVKMLDSNTFEINKEVAQDVEALYRKFIADKNNNYRIDEDELSKFFNYFGINLHEISTEIILDGRTNFGEVNINNLLQGKIVNGNIVLKGTNNKYFSGAIDTLYRNMSKTLEKQESGAVFDIGRYSPNNLLLNDNAGNIDNLVTLDNMVTFNPAIAINIGGKTVNKYADPNATSEKIKKLKEPRVSKDEDNALIEDMLKSAFGKETMLIQMLKKYPELKELIDVIQVSLVALKEGKEKVPDKSRIEDLSIRDYFLCTEGHFTQTYGEAKGKSREVAGKAGAAEIGLRIAGLPFPAISDTGAMNIFKTLVYDLMRNHFEINGNNVSLKRVKKDGNGKILIDQNKQPIFDTERSFVLQELYNQLVQPELNRIINYIVNNTENGVFGNDFKSEQFYILPSFNTLEVTNLDGSKETFLSAIGSILRGSNPEENLNKLVRNNRSVLLDEVNSCIEEIAKDFLDVTDVENSRGLLVEQGIFTEQGLQKIDNKYLERKQGREAKLNKYVIAQIFVYDYIVNYLVNQQTVQATFAGDLTNYSESDKDYFHINEDGTVDTSNIRFDSKKSKEVVGEVEIETEKGLLANQQEKNRIYKHIAKKTATNLSKRLKALLSPGKKLATEQKNSLQIILQDNNSSSEVLDVLFKTWYPDEYTNEIQNEIKRVKELENIIFTREVDKQDEELTEKQDKELKNLINKFKKFPAIVEYFNNKTSDGQEWVTWQDALTQLRSQGRMSAKDFKEIWSKLEDQSTNGVNEENKLTSKQKSIALMQPSKPLYAGLHFEEDNTQRFVYIKSSSFPLIPELTIGFNLDNVRKNMEEIQKNNPEMNVRVAFASAVKSGRFNTSLNISELYKDTKDVDWNLVNSKSIVLLKENFSIQQDKPNKTEKNLKKNKRDEISRGTQPEKIILGNGINLITEDVFPNLFDKNILEDAGIGIDEKGNIKEMISGQDLWNIYNELYKQEQQLLVEKLFSELGIKSFEDLANKEPAAYEKLASLLNKRLSNKQDKESIKVVYQILDSDNNLVTLSKSELQRRRMQDPSIKIINAEFKLPLWFTPNSRKFEAVLGSIIKNNITKPKLPGSSSAVASEEGFRISHYEDFIKKYDNKGIIYTDAFDGTLKSTRRAEDGSVKAAQVFMPNKFSVKYKDENGIWRSKLINMADYVNKETNRIDSEKLPQELREYFSYRIPTSAHQSGMLLEVAGFLPKECGDLMVVPKDSTIQMGEDFDIDMRNWYMLNYTIDKKGNFKRLTLEDKISKKEISRLEQEYQDYKNRLLNSISAEQSSLWQDNKSHLVELSLLLATKRKLMQLKSEDIDLIKVMEESLEIEISDFVSEVEDINAKIRELKEIIIPSNSTRIEELNNQMYDVLAELNKNFEEEENNAYIRLQQSKDLYHRMLENNIISLYKSVYKSPDNRVQQKITQTVNTNFAESSADLIDETISSENDWKRFTLYNPVYQQKVMALGHSGQIGVSVHSNWVIFSSILQQISINGQPIKLMNINEEEEEEDFYMKFGKFSTDGTLGRIRALNDGREIAEINMENQNASVDNQKLLVMGRRNENAHTINVFALMENLGLDNDGVKINGKTYSYASLFIAQPIIRRYAELMDYYNSSTVSTYEDTTELVRKQLIKEFGNNVNWQMEESKNGGEDVPILGRLDTKIKYGNDKEKGIVDNLTSLSLYNHLLDKSGNFQWTVFEHFIQLNSKVRQVNELQQLLNIEKSGIGQSFFETIRIKDNLINLADKKGISNVTGLIGDYQYLNSNDSDFQVKDRKLRGQEYIYIDTVDGQAVYIKPATFFGHKIVNTIATGYNLWKNLLPYESPAIQQQIDDIFKDLNISKDSKAGDEYRTKYVMQAMKDYMFLKASTLFMEDGETIESNRKKLFMDSSDNTSLAALLNELRKNKHPLLEEPFFKNLEFEINMNDEPSIIKYNSDDNTKLNKNQAYRTLKNLLRKGDTVLLQDGIKIKEKTFYENYTYNDLVKDLLKYALIADQANGAIGFRQHFPLEVFDELKNKNGERYNITGNLRDIADISSSDENYNIVYNGYIKSLHTLLGTNNLDRNTAILENNRMIDRKLIEEYVDRINRNLGENTATIINSRGDVKLPYSPEDMTSNFVRQFIQHHAKDVRTVKRQDVDGIKKQVKRLDQAYKIKLPNIYMDRKFITIKDKDNIYLYEKVGAYFKRLNTLGAFGMNEYKIGGSVETSLVEKNNTTASLIEQSNAPIINTKNTVSSAIKQEKEVQVSESLSEITQEKYQPLANLLSQSASEELTVRFTSELDESRNGEYYPDTKEILVSNTISREAQEEAIMEEVLHDITVNILEKYIKSITTNKEKLEIEVYDKNNIPPSVVRIINIYKDAYKVIYKELKQKGQEDLLTKTSNEIVELAQGQGLNREQQLAYRATDINEYLAGLFFTPELARVLNNKTYKKSGKSFFRAFAESIIKAIMGDKVKIKDTLYQRAVDSLVELLESANVESEQERFSPSINSYNTSTTDEAEKLLDQYSSVENYQEPFSGFEPISSEDSMPVTQLGENEVGTNAILKAAEEMVKQRKLSSPKSTINLNNSEKSGTFAENNINDDSYENNRAETRLDNQRTVESSAFNRLVGEQSKGNGNYKTISEASNLIKESIETSKKEEQSSWDKEQFLRNLRRSAIKNNVWIRDIKTLTSKKLEEGTESEVYFSNDKKSVLKLNSFSRVETPNDFNILVNRLIAHNEVFPDVAYSITGFGLDSMNNISIILEQPYIESTEIPTQFEIDSFLEKNNFKRTAKTVRGRPVWTNGIYEISDVVPSNVLKDINGNLRFIDADIMPVYIDASSEIINNDTNKGITTEDIKDINAFC